MSEPSSVSHSQADQPTQAFWIAVTAARLTLRTNSFPPRRWLALRHQFGARRRGGRPLTIATQDRLTLAGWFSPARPRTARRPPVILLHGWAEMKELYLRHAYRFNAAGHDVLLIDHRGHGGSSRAVTTFGLREQADLAQAIATSQQLGLMDQRPILMGHSMGAVTALLGAARKLPIAGVIASAPFKDLPEAVDSFRRAWAPWLSSAGLQHGFERAASEAGFALEDVAPIRVIHQIDVPILFVEAGRDRVLPPDRHVKPLREALPGDQTRTFRVPGANHFNLRRRNWPGLEEALLSFCAACPCIALEGPSPQPPR